MLIDKLKKQFDIGDVLYVVDSCGFVEKIVISGVGQYTGQKFTEYWYKYESKWGDSHIQDDCEYFKTEEEALRHKEKNKKSIKRNKERQKKRLTEKLKELGDEYEDYGISLSYKIDCK